MAMRVKTIEYAFPSRNSSLASATRNDFAAITVYIPETTSRTFRSVMVMVAVRDNVTSATTLTSPLVGVKLGGAAFGDVTLGNPPPASGESANYVFWRDATAYFTSNFGSGASQTCQVGVNFTGPATINISVKLYITYEFDDNGQSTLVKTVHIPMDSGLGALTASLVEMGTNQIPNLSTFLPESSVTFRNIWIELWYNESTAGAANDAQLGMQIDSGTEHLTGIHESGMASSCSGMYIWDQGASPAWATNAVHAFKLRSSTITTASTFNHVGIILCVTYEYASSSSTIINSLTLTLPYITTPYTNTAADAVREAIELFIEEPSTITLVQSGALVSYSQIGNISPICMMGGGSARTYTDTSLAFCGASFFTQRVDSGGAGGSAYSLARGKNSLGWSLYLSNASTNPSSFSCVLFLNYTSSKATDGAEAHNHSTFWIKQQSQAQGNQWTVSGAAMVVIPETAFFCNGVDVWIDSIMGWTTTNTAKVTVLDVEDISGDRYGTGFVNYPLAGVQSDGEMGWYPIRESMLRQEGRGWDRWASDPDTFRRDLEGSRRFRLSEMASGTGAFGFWLTHHSITKTISGTVSGSGGGTVNVKAHKDDEEGDLVATGSRSGNGAYSLTVYDDVVNHVVRAKEDATHVGASDIGVAS